MTPEAAELLASVTEVGQGLAHLDAALALAASVDPIRACGIWGESGEVVVTTAREAQQLSRRLRAVLVTFKGAFARVAR